MRKKSSSQRRTLVIGLALCSLFGCLDVWSAPASAALPDGRVYELVSPAASEGNASVRVPAAGSIYLSRFGEHGTATRRPFEVSSSGEAVAYPADLPITGGSGNSSHAAGDAYLAKRSPNGGWTSVDIQPPGVLGAAYEAFSSDLSAGVLISGEPLAPSAPAASYEDLYLHSTGGGGEYLPFYSGTPPVGSRGIVYSGTNAGTSVVPAASHLLFSAGAAMLDGEGPLETELREDVAKRVEESKNVSVLYDSSGGHLSAIDVLSDGKIDADASLGSGQDNVISADGSRVFWSALNIEGQPEALYVRKDDSSPDASTVQVDSSVGGGGLFRTATPDGSKAFFTKGSDLYEFDVESGSTTDLTIDQHGGEYADVQGLVGVSKDGSYVYFVADGVLADGASPQRCEAENIDTNCNLYIRHEGVTRFVAALAIGDGGGIFTQGVSPFDFQEFGSDWSDDPTNRTAEISPDGHNLVFMSRRSLTGYDNRYSYINAEGEAIGPLNLEEVFRYDADDQTLDCVSCNPAGEAPVATEFDTYKEGHPLGAFIPIPGSPNTGDTYQQQVVSEDGSRVFFDSAEPLVPQDTNGWLDVYEWERDGTGSCQQSQGCVYLLSGGTSPESSYLLGTGISGDDVFIITRAQLLARDRNDNDDVYDARVGGVQPPPASACSGAGCQGVPPASPIFATPSSVTFEGLGNFPPPVPAVTVKSKSKTSTRAQKFAKALKACRRKPKNTRRVCEKRVRKQYAPAKKKGTR